MTGYLYATCVEEAIGCLEEYDGGAQIIAGGTDLMPDIREQRRNPRCLVDITRIPGLDQIQVVGDVVQVGAAVTFASIKEFPFIQQRVHALAQAARSLGAVQIQTTATLVGNIVQSMPAADGAIVAVALDAEARVVSRGADAWRPVESLFEGPGVSAIDPSHEMITHIRFTSPSPACGTAWSRIGRRDSLVLPILNCAVRLCLQDEGSQIQHAAIALGPVAPRPYRARQAEAFLRGRRPDVEVFAQAGIIVRQESNPRSSSARASREYRLSVIPVMVKDTLVAAARRAGAQSGSDDNMVDAGQGQAVEQQWAPGADQVPAG